MNDRVWPGSDGEEQEEGGELNAHHPYACSFCGEENRVFVDGSGARTQRFTEDCEVCCRPNLLTIQIHNDDTLEISAEREYDA